MRAKFTRREALFGTVAYAAAQISTTIYASTTKPKTHEVLIKSFKFEPQVIKVKVGDTIRWINKDIAPHTATAYESTWDTGLLNRDQSAEIIVTNDMELDYYCAFHPHMTANIDIRN